MHSGVETYPAGWHAYGYGLRPNRTYGMAAQVRFVGLVTLV